MAILPGISGPRDLDRLSAGAARAAGGRDPHLPDRDVSNTGGHLGPNLGVVELDDRDPPGLRLAARRDRLRHRPPVVRAQAAHRASGLLRAALSAAAWPATRSARESAHDIVESSHASSSLSLGGRHLPRLPMTGQSDRHVVAVVGDGALTGGMTWEALNNISDDNNRRLVIVVNDNGRSYAPTIGGMARYLNRCARAGATATCTDVRAALRQARSAGPRVLPRHARRRCTASWPASRTTRSCTRTSTSSTSARSTATTSRRCSEALQQAKNYGAPVIVHVITQKGRGYAAGARRRGRPVPRGRQIDPETGAPLGRLQQPAGRTCSPTRSSSSPSRTPNSSA